MSDRLKKLATKGLPVAVLLAAVIYTAVGMTTLVSAHARVTSVAWDNPSGPTKLIATATEAISTVPGTSSLAVYNSAGTQVDLGDTTVNPGNPTQMSVSVQPGLAAGVYRADWTTLSAADGHTASGTLYVGLGTDPDYDSVSNPSDNCPWWYNPSQGMPPWSVPSGDSECDGFPDTTTISGRASETFLGTNFSRSCSSTSTANDEPLPDAWPMDFNDDQRTNVTDVLSFKPTFGTNILDPDYDKRYDVTGDASISISDILLIKPFFSKQCSVSGT